MIGQIAVSLVLLVGAALFVRSFYNLITFDAGIRQQGIGVVFVDFERLDDRQAAGPAVHERAPRPRSSECLASRTPRPRRYVPLMGGGWAMGVKAGAADQSTPVAWVSPEYFATMDRRLLAGRLFDARDTATSPPVAVVNEAFMRVFYPGQAALGKTLMTYAEPGYPETHYEIVGVLADAQHATLRGEAPPAVLVPAAQFPDPQHGAAFFVRGADAEAATPPSSASSRASIRACASTRSSGAARPGVAGPRAADGDALGLLRRARRAARHDRPLRRHGLRDAAAAQRSGHPPGAGRAARPGRAHGDAGRRRARACGVGGAASRRLAGAGRESLLFGLSPTDVVTYHRRSRC